MSLDVWALTAKEEWPRQRSASQPRIHRYRYRCLGLEPLDSLVCGRCRMHASMAWLAKIRLARAAGSGPVVLPSLS